MLCGNAFFLVKSDPKASSSEVARFIRKLPGLKEVWMTEGEYSFVARFSAPEGAVKRIAERIAREAGVLELSCLNAPIRVGQR